METGWVQEIAERRRKEVARRDERERKALSDRELIRAGARREWERIVALARSAQKLLVDELGAGEVFRLRLEGDRLLFLRRGGRETYRLIFDETFVEVRSPRLNWRLMVVGASQLAWQRTPDDNTCEYSNESIVRDAVQAALDRM